MMGVGGVMVTAVRMGAGRAARGSRAGRAWASTLAAGMVLAGAAVVLLAWSVDPASEVAATPPASYEVDVDDSSSIVVTPDGSVFDTPLRRAVSAGAPASGGDAATPDAAPATTGRPAAAPGAAGPGSRGETSTPTPTRPAPTPTAPAPTGGGGTKAGTTGGSGGGSTGPKPTPPPVVVPPTTPPPPTGGTVTAGANVTASVGSVVGVQASPESATVTAGGITVKVPLLGASLGG